MKKLLLLTCLFISQLLMAGPVTSDEARQKAAAFIATKTMGQKQLKAAKSSVRRAPGNKSQTEPLYIFNMEGGGYIIVSGDDRTEEILGYSTTGVLNEFTIPDAMQELLQQYADIIQNLDALNVPENSARKTASRRISGKAAISPLLTCEWNQGLPYNKECPVKNGVQTVTGCVATAMAQVMYYHKWPHQTTTEIPAYTSVGNVGNIDMPAIPAGDAINWSAMTPTYNDYQYDGTEAEDAVAHLMKLCGCSTKMRYGTSSGTYTSIVAEALVNYFDYEEQTVQYLEREGYSYEHWQSIIYKELEENRPVLMSGANVNSGHAFVCDGYDSDDLFHINWGWGGQSNGYFKLNLLYPNEQGIGGSTAGYNITCGIVIGVKPNDGIYTAETPLLTTRSIGTRDNITSFTRNTNGFTFFVMYSAVNWTGESRYFDLGVRIVDADGNTVKEFADPLFQNNKLDANYSWTTDDSEAVRIDLDNSIPDGNYRVILICRPAGTGEWKPCKYSDLQYIPMTIEGDQLYVSQPSLEVTNVQVTGNNKQNSAQTIQMTITNTGGPIYTNVIFYDNKQWDAEHSTWVYDDAGYFAFLDLENGQQTTLQFNYTPETAGTHTLTFYTQKNDIQLGDAVVLNIEGAGIPEFSVASVEGYDTDREAIVGTTFDMTLKVENIGAGSLNETVYVYLIQDNSYYSGAMEWTLNLAPSESTTRKFAFNDLSTGHIYSLYVTDTNGNRLFWSPKYTLVSDSGDGTPNISVTNWQIDNYDATAKTIAGNLFNMHLTIANTGDGDFNSQLTVKVYAYSSTYTQWLGFAPSYHNFSVSSGQSRVFDYYFYDPTDSNPQYGLEYYIVQVYNGETLLFESDAFQFVEDAGIEETLYNPQGKPNKVYNVQGVKVGTSDQLNSLQPGLYIIGGKKVMKK